MFPLLVAVVVAADEVLGMVERGEPMGTGDKAIPTVCHPQQDQVLAEVLAALMGGSCHRQLRNTDLHPLLIPPLLRHHSWTFQKPFLLPPELTSWDMPGFTQTFCCLGEG